jgi:hypothetical protein
VKHAPACSWTRTNHASPQCPSSFVAHLCLSAGGIPRARLLRRNNWLAEATGPRSQCPNRSESIKNRQPTSPHRAARPSRRRRGPRPLPQAATPRNRSSCRLLHVKTCSKYVAYPVPQLCLNIVARRGALARSWRRSHMRPRRSCMRREHARRQQRTWRI